MKPMYDANVILKAVEALKKAKVPENDRWMINQQGEIIKIPFTKKGKQ